LNDAPDGIVKISIFGLLYGFVLHLKYLCALCELL
jgi:hypothetical protein